MLCERVRERGCERVCEREGGDEREDGLKGCVIKCMLRVCEWMCCIERMYDMT